jgi:hypothetical protein
MLLRKLLGVGLITLWASVVVITFGTHLQTQSPRFKEYQKAMIDEVSASNHGKDFGPGIGIGIVLSTAWPLVGCFCVFVALLFSGGVYQLRAIAVWNRDVALLATGAFSLGCLCGAFVGLGEALDSFQWGFTVLGIGYLLSAVGLILGSIGSIHLILGTHAMPPVVPSVNS